MLQYLIQNDCEYSQAEQAQMAIEGGCTWIVLPETTDREASDGVVEVCREAGVILTMKDNAELARELGIFGVIVTETSDRHVSAPHLREELGPEAVIGWPVGSVASLKLLADADIDFGVVAVPGEVDGASLIAEARSAGVELPVVAVGEFTPAQMAELIRSGYSGVLTGGYIARSADPVAATAECLKAMRD